MVIINTSDNDNMTDNITENITDNMTDNIKKFQMLQIMSLIYH